MTACFEIMLFLAFFGMIGAGIDHVFLALRVRKLEQRLADIDIRNEYVALLEQQRAQSVGMTEWLKHLDKFIGGGRPS